MRKRTFNVGLLTGLALVIAVATATSAIAGVARAGVSQASFKPGVYISANAKGLSAVKADSMSESTKTYSVSGPGGCVSVPTTLGFRGGSVNLTPNFAAFLLQLTGGKFYIGILRHSGDDVVILNGALNPDQYLEPGWNGPFQIAEGACASAYVPQPPRTGYCAAAGNFNPFTGAPIKAGTFLDLWFGQPNTDPSYKGATPANFKIGVGLTCDGGTPTGRTVDSQDDNTPSEGTVHTEVK